MCVADFYGDCASCAFGVCREIVCFDGSLFEFGLLRTLVVLVICVVCVLIYLLADFIYCCLRLGLIVLFVLFVLLCFCLPLLINLLLDGRFD